MQLKLTAITRSFGARAALDDLNLDLPEVHALVLIGPSGGGKSTLLRVLAGLEIPDQGMVEFDGERLAYDEQSLLRHRRSVGTVFQSFNLFPHLTALENITLPLEKVHNYSRSEAREYARALLARFQLEDHTGKRPAQLSGGQKQRVAIARAVAVRPRFFLFDEPTSALDPEMTAEVLDLIEELRKEGRDLILVTHEMGFARHVADYCAFVADGRIEEYGPAEKLFRAPETPGLQNFLARILKY